MAEQDLDCRPHHIRGHDDAWWYEEPRGICFVVQAFNEHGEVATKQRWIPWKSIKNALARRER